MSACKIARFPFRGRRPEIKIMHGQEKSCPKVKRWMEGWIKSRDEEGKDTSNGHKHA